MRFNLRSKIFKQFKTQQEFSDFTGINKQRVSLIINGARPSVMEKKIIECVLGCSKTLFYNKENMDE